MSKNSPITYVAFLRGINVGGNNIIRMAALKETFEKLGFSAVRTYIQSGNVIFHSVEKDTRVLEQKIEQALSKEYHYTAKVVLRSFAEMEQVIAGLPKNWGENTEKRYNVMFLRAAIDSQEILSGIAPKDGSEEVLYRPGVLYWTANTGDITQTTMAKLSTQKIYREMTVRNLNTTRKIFELMAEVEGA